MIMNIRIRITKTANAADCDLSVLTIIILKFAIRCVLSHFSLHLLKRIQKFLQQRSVFKIKKEEFVVSLSELPRIHGPHIVFDSTQSHVLTRVRN